VMMSEARKKTAASATQMGAPMADRERVQSDRTVRYFNVRMYPNIKNPRTDTNSQWPENDSSLNGDVSMGDNTGSLIFIKPKPVAS
jgi:hypothetical protein